MISLYRKLPEEATELTLDCALGADKDKIKQEGADVLFQLMLILAKHDIEMTDIINVLYNRHLERQKNNEKVVAE